MSRKRTTQPSNTSTDNQDSTTATATVEPEATVAQGADVANSAPVPPQESFVERLERERGQKRPESRIPDPFGIASDYAAGVHLFENRQDRLMVIKFDEKPSTEVLNHLKDIGFRWNPRDKIWVTPIRPDSARAIRIEAERAYQTVSSMIRQEKGFESSPEIPF